MSEQHVYPVPPEVAAAAHCDNEKYLEMYKRSVEDPEGFWDAQGRRIDWIKPYSKVKDVSFARNDVHIRWFEDGT
ncbi:MAG: acetyl-coenzyme A synthetase N-terminal domain-containing protein, partial [Gammaproteobacteria bacterium]